MDEKDGRRGTSVPVRMMMYLALFILFNLTSIVPHSEFKIEVSKTDFDFDEITDYKEALKNIIDILSETK